MFMLGYVIQTKLSLMMIGITVREKNYHKVIVASSFVGKQHATTTKTATLAAQSPTTLAMITGCHANHAAARAIDHIHVLSIFIRNLYKRNLQAQKSGISLHTYG